MLLVTDKLEEIKDLYGPSDYERIVKLQDFNISENERKYLLKMLIGNRLAVHIKRIRGEINVLVDLYSQLRDIRRSLKKIWSEEIFSIKQLKIAEKEAKEHIQKVEEVISQRNDFLVLLLNNYNLVATDHDFAQIINANILDIEKYRIDFNKKNDDKSSFFQELIFVYNCECRSDDRDNKEFIHNFKKVPLWKCMCINFKKKLKEDTKLKNEVWEGLEEIISEVRGAMVKQKKDKYGKIESVEKHYPPLKLIK